MKKTFLLFLTALLIISAPDILSADSKPIQLSLFTPIQIFPENTSIEGFRFNLIYGRNANFTGLDIGLVNRVTGNFAGLQWGGISVVDGDFTGWQSNFVNLSQRKFKGFGSGVVNWANDVTGFQWGFVNKAERFNGFQLGIVNWVHTMDKGLQIGLINIIKQNGQFPIFPIVNWSF